MNQLRNPQQSFAETENHNLSDLHGVMDKTTPGQMVPHIALVSTLLLISLGIDVALNHQLYAPHLSVDALGRSTGNGLVSWMAACLTASAFLCAGGAWAAGWHRVAMGIGAAIFTVVGILVAPQALSFVQELAATLGLDESFYGDGLLDKLASFALPVVNCLLKLVGVVCFTMLYCAAGAVACVMEGRLAALLHKLQLRAEARADITRHVKSRAPVETMAAINRLLATSSKAELETAARQAVQTALVQLAKRARAHRAGKPVTAALALLLACAVALPAAAQVPGDDVADAPTFMLLLDQGRFSAARDPSLTDEIMKDVDAALNKMPLGAMIYVTTVGSVDDIPEMFATRVQTRVTAEGMPLAVARSKIRNLLARFANRPHPVSSSSAIVRGWFDAAQHINPKATGNQVIFVSDLAETVDTDCRQVATCHLPAPGFTLPGTNLLALGVGLGQPAAQTTAIFREWKRYFEQAGLRVRLIQSF